LKHMVRDTPKSAHQWQIVIAATFLINQAFSHIFSVAASIAIILGSVSAIRNGGLSRSLAIYGCVIAPLIILGPGDRSLAARRIVRPAIAQC
jgi:hypothetical protein